MPVSSRFAHGVSIVVSALALAGCGGGGGGGDDSANAPRATADNSQPAKAPSAPDGAATSSETCIVTVKEGTTTAMNCSDVARFTPNIELGSYRGITKSRDPTQEPSSCRVSLHPTEGLAITTYSSNTFDEITSRHEVKTVMEDGTVTEMLGALSNNPALQLQMLTVMDVPRLLVGMFMWTPDVPGPANAAATISSIDEQKPLELICTELEKE